MTSTTTTAIEKKVGEAGAIVKTDTQGRRRISREKREEMIREYERSGMSAAEFAKWTGMKYTTLCGWLQRSRTQACKVKKSRKGMKWLQAVIAKPEEAAANRGIMIHVGGSIRVEVADGKTAIEMLKGLGVKGC